MSEQSKEIDWAKPIRALGKSGSMTANLATELKMYVVQIETVWGPRSGFFDEYGKELKFDRVETGPYLIENVPEDPEYAPLKIGDRLAMNGRDYMIVRVGGSWGLINTLSGAQWASPLKLDREYGDVNCLLLEEFKTLLRGKAEQWQKIYRTVRRQGN